MLVVNGRGTEKIRNGINLVRSAFSRLHSCFCLLREEPLRAKCRIYQWLAHFCFTVTKLGQCEWLVFDNGGICRILHMKRRGRVPTAELPSRLRFTSIPAQIV